MDGGCHATLPRYLPKQKLSFRIFFSSTLARPAAVADFAEDMVTRANSKKDGEN